MESLSTMFPTIRHPNKQAFAGFTLIELAVVIALIAILASVAMIRYNNLTQSAAQAVANSYINALTTGASEFTAATSQSPTGYDQFVSATNIATAPQTVGILADRNGAVRCAAPTATTITCNFPEISATTQAVYTYNGGATTLTWTP
jgi:prepilin-type N-terminal cleavage/methylation domain-containing protein